MQGRRPTRDDNGKVMRLTTRVEVHSVNNDTRNTWAVAPHVKKMGMGMITRLPWLQTNLQSFHTRSGIRRTSEAQRFGRWVTGCAEPVHTHHSR